MEEFLKNENRLIECYRGAANKAEAEEICSTYKDSMVNSITNGDYNFKNIMKEKWRIYYKTKRYYEYEVKVRFV